MFFEGNNLSDSVESLSNNNEFDNVKQQFKMNIYNNLSILLENNIEKITPI